MCLRWRERFPRSQQRCFLYFLPLLSASAQYCLEWGYIEELCVMRGLKSPCVSTSCYWSLYTAYQYNYCLNEKLVVEVITLSRQSVLLIQKIWSRMKSKDLYSVYLWLLGAWICYDQVNTDNDNDTNRYCLSGSMRSLPNGLSQILTKHCEVGVGCYSHFTHEIIEA